MFTKVLFVKSIFTGKCSPENALLKIQRVLTICYETKKILLIAKLSINLQTDNRVRRLYLNHAYNNT